MIGKRKAQRDLFDVGNVFALELDPHSFHGQLAAAAPRLFNDADFAAFYSDRTGRPSVPPCQLALLTLLQHEAGCSDLEAVERSAYDLRWAAVLGKAAGAPLCAKRTFQLFRAHLVLHDAVLMIFQNSIAEARRAGLLGKGPLKIALDTKPIVGRGAVLDTYNLLAQAIRTLIRALAKPHHQTSEAWAAENALSRYLGESLKGSADLDWSDKEARQPFFAAIVTDARRLLRLAGEALDSDGADPMRESAHLLEQLLLQDVVETKGEDGTTHPSLRQGTAPGRIPSVTDPEQRHGRKSSSKRFNGHKGAIAVDRDSQIILDATVLPGCAPDAEGALEQVERVEANTGQGVAESQGDCAYGGAATRQAFADAGRELVAKVPQEAQNRGRFPKSAFVLDVVGGAVTCPAGHTTREFTAEGDGGKVFRFGALCAGCPLRSQCTEAKEGRTVRMHPLEEALQAARAYQQSEEGRKHLRERVVVEHRLARLGQLGMGQARYVGRAKTRCQLLLLATIANLRRTWNWVAAQAGPSQGADGGKSVLRCGGGGKAAKRTRSERGGIRRGFWRALWRRLQPRHGSVLPHAIGLSAAGFRLHF